VINWKNGQNHPKKPWKNGQHLTSKQADKAMELVGTWLFSTTQQSSENER
jgi:uncharacterized protein YeaC (DUF1315 family)